ncbi:beta-ketoacyl synthase N-terminal-like domain-containing protein [Kitasatospora phosalacinea]|uniref:Beta-ketoacyl synthase N-terminal-like domain-containing protein n=1 Tax=Kitasatospora phosalacinea TaxID=2065 RepID=A0ABW6GDF6_9ACTN
MQNDDDLIAIVAMECRLPQAADVDEFWARLVDGHTAVSDLTDEQLATAGVPVAQRSRPDHVKRAGVLEGVAEFDSGYFGYSEREADILDVQQRLMLEKSVALLERANIDPQRTAQRIGVFAGSGMSTYVTGPLQRPDLMDALGEMVVRHGNDKDFLATRISYKLNLHGPSVNVQTACSTGLVAVHSAVQSLLLNECDAAIAGAVYVRVPQEAGYRYQVGGVLSPDGVCRPFDARANGTLFTNGLGLVLLKRLADAVADGDRVHAVIAGSAVNNDGAQKVSFTAPSVSGQVAVLREALEISGADPAEVGYLEAHGTGTALGDPIEVEAIKQAYGSTGVPCGIGSLKGNFGHLNIAAGIVGLIKAALVLEHGFVPPTVNVSEVNPALELDGSRYFVTTESLELDRTATHWAGVSAFGMGGTNGHVLLRSHRPQEAPAEAPEGAPEETPAGRAAEDGRPSILAFSARSRSALRGQAAALAARLAADPDAVLAEYAHTLHEGRTRHPHRAALAAVRPAEAVARLRAERYHTSAGADSDSDSDAIAFVFAGQGTQRLAMGAGLAARNPAFARRLAEAGAAVGAHTGFDPLALLKDGRERDTAATEVAQPLLFAVEYALAQTLLDSGLTPHYLFGHSLGEVVAASVAGVFDLATAAELVAVRARAMAACPGGAMLAVSDPAPFAELVADGSLVVASVNSPRQQVLSGSLAAVDRAAALAAEAGVVHQRLATSHAFHSPLMQGAAEEFLAFLATRELHAPRMPVVSNITGRVLSEYEARNPRYWAEHLVRPVQFGGSVDTLREAGVTRFVEIGAGRSMSNLVRANFAAAGAPAPLLAQTLGEPEAEAESFADALALGWATDPQVAIADHTAAARMTALPTYAFEKRIHWVEPATGFATGTTTGTTTGPVPAAAPAPAATAAPAAPTAAPAAAAAPAGTPEGADEEVRQIVAQIFQNFLGGSATSTDLGFFELGGNSLMAIQLINKLRETFQLDLSVRDFYENSSIDETSCVITAMLIEEPAHV